MKKFLTKKGSRPLLTQPLFFTLLPVSVCRGRIFKTNRNCGQNVVKEVNNLVVALAWWLKSLFLMWQTSNKSKRTKIKIVLRAAKWPPRMRRYRSAWSTGPQVRSKNEDILVLSSAPTLIFTGQGKIFKGFHVCYDFSASKGGRKIHQCLFFLKQFVV